MIKREDDNSKGITGVVLGILSIFNLSFIGVLMGIVGLVFSIKQHKTNKNSWSKAGIILNIIGIVIGIILIYFLATYALDYIAQLQAI